MELCIINQTLFLIGFKPDSTEIIPAGSERTTTLEELGLERFPSACSYAHIQFEFSSKEIAKYHEKVLMLEGSGKVDASTQDKGE